MVEQRKMKRRTFLRTTLYVLGGSVVACGGLGFAATRSPEITFENWNYGEQTMDAKKVLVVYASKTGSTAEVAAVVGETVSKNGFNVEVRPVKEVKDISQYQAVILGSAIRAGSLLPEAMKFIQNQQATLQQKPFAAFVVCLTMKDDTPENRKIVSAYLDPLRALVKPATEGLFAGQLNPTRLNFFERLIMKAMKAPEGDFRRLDEVQSWSGTLTPYLS